MRYLEQQHAKIIFCFRFLLVIDNLMNRLRKVCWMNFDSEYLDFILPSHSIFVDSWSSQNVFGANVWSTKYLLSQLLFQSQIKEKQICLA